MTIIPIQFHEIKDFAKKSFEQSLKDNFEPLQQVKAYGAELRKTNPLLEEMFVNDFSYEWNQLQAKHFLKTGILMSVGEDLPTIPSVWVITWVENALKGVKKLKIDTNFDFRSYSFENTKFAVDKLSMIFEHVFQKNEAQVNLAIDMRDSILPSPYYYKVNNQVVENAFVNTVYSLAAIQSFGEIIDKDRSESLWKGVLECYYGKYVKSNAETLFTTYLTGLKKTDNRQQKTTELFEIKSQALALRNEDSSYWNYFMSIEHHKSLLESLQDSVDFSSKDQPSLAQALYVTNFHDKLQKELANTPNTGKLIKKVIKL